MGSFFVRRAQGGRPEDRGGPPGEGFGEKGVGIVRVAVFGATGMVGREMLSVLEERRFPAEEVIALASPRSEGTPLPFRGGELRVRAVEERHFAGVDLAIFSAGGGASREWASVAVRQGAVVVDNSSAWRMDPAVPLVVPEVNPGDALRHRGIIANPNCSTIITLMALAPLHREAELGYFSAVTFQSVSGSGRKGVEELERTTRDALGGADPQGSLYPHPIAFNVLPQVGSFDEGGMSDEEWKMVRESRKILGLPGLDVSSTTTRVPVFCGHSVAVTARFRRDLSPERAREVLAQAPGVVVEDDPSRGIYPHPRRAAGTDPVYVGRLRRDPGMGNALAFWVVGDNVRKGAALNAVQIGELLLRENSLGKRS